jgi:hypothetical protein
MGQNSNTGQNSLVVYGDPTSFQRLISSHGQLCKMKQALFCPCTVKNHGSPDMYCLLCHGNGFVYTYQRRFMIADEQNSKCNREATEIYPIYTPILEVTKVERVTSQIQGGIETMPVKTFNDTTIFVENKINAKYYDSKRVTYFFDGWTKVEEDILTVDEKHGLMWPTKTYYDAAYQSSNPLRAESDIAQLNKIWNSETGEELTDYTRIGNTIKTKRKITVGRMKASYYYADLTQIITADLKTADDLETWTNDIESGTIRMAMFPWYNIAKGDIVVIAADAQFKDELFTHRGDLDQLWQIEVFELNDICLDEDGNTYYRDEDYILIGNRYILWISENKPKDNKVVSIKYGYKPSFICFKDNPEPNNLENRRYPKIIYAKSWTKTNKDDIAKLETTAE